MNAYINYFIEANIGLVVTILFYQLLLRGETHFNFKRTFLLIGIFASLLFPLVKIQTQASVIPSISQVVPTYFLPELVIGESAQNTETSAPINGWIIAEWMYLSVSILFLALLLFRIVRISYYLKKSPSVIREGKFKIIESDHDFPTFSFFHYIFIGNTSAFTDEEKAQIIKHEITHATKLHSLDVLLIELLKVLFWFNPVIHYLKKLMTSIHEFQADERAVDEQDVNQYCNLLARIALQSADYPIANHFNNSLTLKRIAMMKTAKTKLSRWKIAAIAPLLAGLFIFVACQDQVITDIKDVASKSTMVDEGNYPPEIKTIVDKLKTESPSKSFFVIEMIGDDMRKKLDALEAENRVKAVAAINDHVTKENRRFVIFEQGMETQQLSNLTKTDDEIFTIVEEPASPVGGMPEFFKYVGAEMKYPLAARQNNINGKVFIEFVVNEDGHISDVKSVKGIGGGCDEEAIRVVQNARNWNAARQGGKAVKQRMVLPIMFNFDSQKTAFIAFDEPQGSDVEFVVALSSDKSDNKAILSGSVQDVNGKPIDGMNIVIAGTTTGTVTTQEGKFKLVTAITSGELVFSFIGYKTKSVNF